VAPAGVEAQYPRFLSTELEKFIRTTASTGAGAVVCSGSPASVARDVTAPGAIPSTTHLGIRPRGQSPGGTIVGDGAGVGESAEDGDDVGRG